MIFESIGILHPFWMPIGGRKRQREKNGASNCSELSEAGDQSRRSVWFHSESFLPSRPHPFWFFSLSLSLIFSAFSLCVMYLSRILIRRVDFLFLVAAIKISKEAINGMEVKFVDIAALPMLDTDLEVNGTYQAAVEAFRQNILEADSILFASPEYNFSVTGTAYPSSSFFFHFFVFQLCVLFLYYEIIRTRRPLFFFFFSLALCCVWLVRNSRKRQENFRHF